MILYIAIYDFTFFLFKAQGQCFLCNKTSHINLSCAISLILPTHMYIYLHNVYWVVIFYYTKGKWTLFYCLSNFLFFDVSNGMCECLCPKALWVFTPCDGKAIGCHSGDAGRRWRTWFVWIRGAHQHFTGTALSLCVRRYELQGKGTDRVESLRQGTHDEGKDGMWIQRWGRRWKNHL